MAKPKIKIDVKDFFLRRGELLVMGMAGFCLIVLDGLLVRRRQAI